MQEEQQVCTLCLCHIFRLPLLSRNPKYSKHPTLTHTSSLEKLKSKMPLKTWEAMLLHNCKDWPRVLQVKLQSPKLNPLPPLPLPPLHPLLLLLLRLLMYESLLSFVGDDCNF